MKYFFITGTPASGKSTLAKRISTKLGWKHIDIDKWRGEMCNDPLIKPWVEFFMNKDELKYWQETSPEEDFQNLVKQSEAFWPFILKEINKIIKSGEPAIFEAVNILPHLAKSDLSFDGIVLINNSPEVIFERIKKDPRWGETEELQKIESIRFVEEAMFYKIEAEKYGYKVFDDPLIAEQEFLKKIK